MTRNTPMILAAWQHAVSGTAGIFPAPHVSMMPAQALRRLLAIGAMALIIGAAKQLIEQEVVDRAMLAQVIAGTDKVTGA